MSAPFRPIFRGGNIYFLVAFLLWICAVSGRAQDRPRGIYSLGTKNSLNGLRTNDFVDGFTLRVGWNQLETAQGVYNFTLISNVIGQLQPLGKKLTIEMFVTDPPAYVVSNATEVWTNIIGGNPVPLPVPWETNALNSYRTFMQSLANCSVPDAAQGGALVALSQHPTLAQMDSPVVGLQSIRDLSGTITNLASYQRSNFINAVVHSAHSSRDAFASKFGFLAYFSMSDTQNASYGGQTLDQMLQARLYGEFNSNGPPKLGYFQENLADASPTTNGLGKLFVNEKNRTYTLLQALTSWTHPFTGASQVTSSNPATGIAFAYSNYSTTYYELYPDDIDNTNRQAELRQWHLTLTAVSTANTPPTISVISNQTINANSQTGLLPFTVGDVETAASNLIVTAMSANGTLLPTNGIALAGAGSNRTVRLTPAANQSGAAAVTVTVSDGSLTVSNSFTLTVNPVTPVTFSQWLSGIGATNPLADPDGDGLNHLSTYATGADLLANQRAAIPVPGVDAQSFFTFSYRARADALATGVGFSMQTSSNLLSWLSATNKFSLINSNSNGDGTVSVTLRDLDSLAAIPEGHRFYRVIVTTAAPPASFTFNWDGTNFTYTDTNRTFTGIMLKPAGNGPFASVIINHGGGGTATGYSLQKAREMSPWGMVCIGPTLTHAAGGETNPVNMGNCPENNARAVACANVLASLAYVDTNRLAIFGHSMGAFNTIGSAALLVPRLRAAAMTAGGVIPDVAGTNNAAPTVSEGNPVRAPFIMFCCDADPVVQPTNSARFQLVLNSNSVPNSRIVYPSNSIPNPSNWHNIHQDSNINANFLTNIFSWFKTYGVLP